MACRIIGLSPGPGLCYSRENVYISLEIISCAMKNMFVNKFIVVKNYLVLSSDRDNNRMIAREQKTAKSRWIRFHLSLSSFTFSRSMVLPPPFPFNFFCPKNNPS